MEEWEYCLLWATPKKTIVAKPRGEIERYSNRAEGEGILSGLQAEGWLTIAFDIMPTNSMTYLFRRRIQSRARITANKPLPDATIYAQTQTPYPQAGISHH